MFVYAFDRDWTVDVNPHPNREAVPLDWVRHLAHETEHAVYAIGNQQLAEEAAIPGVVDVVGRHPDDWDRWLGEKRPDGHYERFPSRRERLSLIRDLHPDADGYVVVDDLDLSDVAGWDHYHAWEFVPAVERGAVDPALPWAREPVTDGGRRQSAGGRRQSAGVMPVDASMLADWLDEFGTEPGFELSYEADGEERTVLLHDVSLVERTVKRPAAAAAIRCVPVAPNADSFTVRVDDVEMLHTSDPPDTLYTADAETPAEEAAALARLAEANPDAVRVSPVLSLLDREDEAPQADALRALRRLAESRPADCTPAIPILGSLLRSGLDHSVDALRTLQLLAAEDPADVAPHVDALLPYLDAEQEIVRRQATRCIADVAAESPGDVLDAVPLLSTRVEDDDTATKYAVYALNCVAKAYPVEVKPVAGVLGPIVTDESAADNVRLNATAALGRVVGEFPSVGVTIVDDVAQLFDAENHMLRNNAIGLVGDVATVHTDVVEPYAEEIGALLAVDDTYTRINASAALGRVAEDFPDSVAGATGTFVDLLEDEHDLVRLNACWALGHLEAESAAAALEARTSEDDDADVRKRAQWALAQIE